MSLLSFRTPTSVSGLLWVPCQVAGCPSPGWLWSTWSWLSLWPSASQPPGDSLDLKTQRRFLYWSTSYRSEWREFSSKVNVHYQTTDTISKLQVSKATSQPKLIRYCTCCISNGVWSRTWRRRMLLNTSPNPSSWTLLSSRLDRWWRTGVTDKSVNMIRICVYFPEL